MYSEQRKVCVIKNCVSEKDSENELKLDDPFKDYRQMRTQLGSPLVAAILCILPSIHLTSKPACGSCLDVWDFQ